MNPIRTRQILIASIRGLTTLALVSGLPLSAFAQSIPSSIPNSEPARTATSSPSARATAAPAPAPAPSWTGFYVGGLFGQGRGEANANTSTVFSSTGYFATSSVPAIAAAGVQTIKPNEWLYGFDAGYNVQTGHVVWGGEFDYQSLKLSESASTTATYPCCAPTDFTVTQSIDTTYLMTIRGRVGVVAGPTLIFGTVGLAMADLNYQAVFTDTFAAAQENGGVDARQQALVWGAGIEVRCGSHVSIKGEYLRADFGDVSTTSTNFQAFTPPISFPTTVFTHSSSFLVNVYRGGVNFRF